VIGIDPGHQTHANSEQEPLRAFKRKEKESIFGHTGALYGRREYKVNLQVGLKSKTAENLGASVVMTRDRTM
jgi:hypothetical protein